VDTVGRRRAASRAGFFLGDLSGVDRDFSCVAGLVLAAVVFYIAPSPPVYGLALLGVVALTWYRLDLALLLVPLFLPYFMAPKHMGPKQLPPSEVFLGLDVVVAAVYLCLGRVEISAAIARVRGSPFLLPALLFLAAGAVGAALATDRHQAAYSLAQTIVGPLVFSCLVIVFTTRRTGWWYLIGALVAAGLLAAAIALAQLATHQQTYLTSVAGTPFSRVRGLYGSPDNLGLLLDRVIPMWLALALIPRSRSSVRFLLWAVGLILSVTLVLTFSRGAWLGVVVGSLFVVALTYSWGRWFAMMCLALAVLGGAVYGPRLVNALQLGHANTGVRRVDVWRSSLAMIRDHPVFGVGPDNFRHYYTPVHQPYQRGCAPGLGYMEPEAWSEPCLSHPHDEFLDFWLSTGLAGLGAFIWLEVVFWRSSALAWRLLSPGRDRALLLGAMGAMLAALVHGLIDNSYFLMDLSTVFWLLCAYVSFVFTSSKA